MSEETKEYTIYPGQIKINNEIFFGLDYKLTDFYNELAEENKELKQKVKYYENFEINKTVDKIRLENNKREKELKSQLQQKENIIKEVREYIETIMMIMKNLFIARNLKKNF